LVLDEIFGGTDIFFSDKLEKRIKNLMQKSGAVIMVSHDTADISNYCNRVIVLSNKKIIFDGDPEQGILMYTNGGN
jgi:ABC-type polysaccharide/polyol phosphate transport system ATPase subunit